MRHRNGFTLIELLIVIAVIGILVTFAVPGYWGARQNALERQGDAMLRLIWGAERVRFLEQNVYVACADTAACNTALGLDLPATTYAYMVFQTDSGANFIACAGPLGGSGVTRWGRIRLAGVVNWGVQPSACGG
ncbi:MAG: prepilin-type N-terminal cleavage/methylation domain-containing protein [Candidatus Omnitrophica bacterium]|nr:prepilin-type N-terminal cleavage/methylation domain-containing protein [Candidatus Omnitrophota bacterium]